MTYFHRRLFYKLQLPGSQCRAQERGRLRDYERRKFVITYMRNLKKIQLMDEIERVKTFYTGRKTSALEISKNFLCKSEFMLGMIC